MNRRIHLAGQDDEQGMGNDTGSFGFCRRTRFICPMLRFVDWPSFVRANTSSWFSDHSLVNALCSQITEEEAAHHPQRNITQSISQKDELVDYGLGDGWKQMIIFLINSDGLTNTFGPMKSEILC